MEQSKETWAEAVITCVSDKAERERLIRMYDYEELVQACLTLGTLALTAKVESGRNAFLTRERDELREALRDCLSNAAIGEPEWSGIEERARRLLKESEGAVCAHEWVDATNEVVEGGELCVKCHAVRATPADQPNEGVTPCK